MHAEELAARLRNVEFTIVAGSGIAVSYDYVTRQITISLASVGSTSLDFSDAVNSQYLGLRSVGGM